MDQPDFLTRLLRRAVIAITGADARDFLQRVVTNGPQGVEPGKAMASSLLTPQGKVLADLMFFDDGAGGLYVDVPVSEAEGLLKRFTLYRLRARAELALRDDLMVAAARGREAAARLEALALSAASDPRDMRLGLRAIVPVSSDIPDQAASHDAARIALIVPELGADYAPAAFFSTDVNHDLLNAIHYRKGCFVGQEVASRMHRKGGVRKRTAGVSADTALEAGALVMAGEVPLGEIINAAGREGLAVIRVDRLEQAAGTGVAVTVGGTPAKISLPQAQ
ncbi:MAG: folate-binding protein YgfZ [Oceanicaulis sp.]|uniref:CAF17-like 4Fe-4S cluster assembly/insertion protein YgfZ n=1 Tax=Glycocaulis sp. TaxID=1969725 RepID=UPI0025B8801B|nr:hypothetical protein [Glycocaulis sp.]MCC5981661.1 folate-binding protein YgfZ [Oceanicaulis sp.]MCH8520495.1 hypothetical protein [Glycocaulis sp.]